MSDSAQIDNPEGEGLPGNGVKGPDFPGKPAPERGWRASAQAWVATQGDLGDFSRREILDPALGELLGDVQGLSILDLGCGEGRYSRVLGGKGAVVSGIDPVEEFIAIAQAKDPDGKYLEGFAEFLPYPAESFDIVLSYLTLIDILDYKAAVAEMARVLKPTGSIIIVTISNIASTSAGWIKDESGRRLYRPVDRYMEEFVLDLEWNGIRVENYHRPLSAILGAFFKNGLALTGFLEPLPNPPTLRDEHRAPNFQILSFQRLSAAQISLSSAN